MTDTAAAEMTATPGRGFRITVAQKTDTGLVRSENQDYAILSSPAEDAAGKGRLMIVADGMGGHRGGATASRLAATTIKDAYLQSPVDDPVVALREALTEANSKIFTEAQSNPDVRGMGTTTSALVIRDGHAFVAHVGDSRIYLIRQGQIRQLTDDHSLVASMVREGLLTSKEAEVHPRRNVLQRSMGVGENVDIDVLSPLPIQNGDTFLLCSDGLHGLVKEPEMLEVAQLPIDRAVEEFVRRALDRGAPDNVTVVVARVEGEGDATAASAASPHSADDVDTDRMRAAQAPAPGSSAVTRVLVIILSLTLVGMLAAYLLGYRLDPAIFGRMFSR